MGIAQKWLTAMVAIGAAALVIANPKGFASATTSVSNLVGGTEATLINTTGKK